MIVQRVVVTFVALLMPCIAGSAPGSTQLIDYLRSQTEVASRLLSLVRPLCPNQTFGEIEPLVELTATSVAWSQLTAEATRGVMNEAASLQLDGEIEKSLEVTCDALRASMRSLMNDASHDETGLTRAHPAVWAPMILVGVD